MRVIILPGNGNFGIGSEWYLHAKAEFEKMGHEVVAEGMPDPDLARKEHWLPWIEEKSRGADKVVLIGHSTGAVAIMRYLESHQVHGAVLVAAYHTDLGDAKEKASHYFDEPWQWENIKKNAKWIVQFASTDDPYIPIEQPRHIKDRIGSDYREYENQRHFGDNIAKREFPELIEAVKGKLAEHH